MMIRNYLKIAWRNLTRNKSYTAINLAGLAIGFACCILIALYVQGELSYDNFHEKADRIVFVGTEHTWGGERSRSTTTPYPLAQALIDDLPSVENSVRVLQIGSGSVSRDGESFSRKERVFHVEPSFLQVFSFPLVTGDPATALAEPNTAVISEDLAETLFAGEDPMGKTFVARRFGEQEYRVTGVAQSKENSYVNFDALLSFSTTDYAERMADSWGGRMFLTFALLQPGATLDDFNQQGEALAAQYLGADTETQFFGEPITSLYLSDLVSVDGFRGEWRYIYIFGTVALIILLLGCVNYMNLMTARATKRAKEVGVRKTVGARRSQIAGQFLSESVMLTLAAFVIALGISRTALPAFNSLFETQISLNSEVGGFVLLLAGAALVTGLVAGSYPALYLSGFRPIRVLRGAGSAERSGGTLRKGLVTFQFALAIALVACTVVVYQQLQFAQDVDLGFWEEQVVYIGLPANQHQPLKAAILDHPAIQSASIAQALPGHVPGQFSRLPSDFSAQVRTTSDDAIIFRPFVVDHDYTETLGLDFVAGRAFDAEFASDEREAHIINETAARALGWSPEEAIGKPFSVPGSDATGEVVGVVRDFHITSVHEPIDPVVLHIYQGSIRGMDRLAMRVPPDQLSAARSHIEEQWVQFSDGPVEISFLDEDFGAMYETERRLSRVFALFAALAILIACLGLFGLAAYAAEQRRQEIGIRKVLGATAQSIVALLSKDFLKLVLVGFVLAAPAAYYVMSRWLEDFAYRIDIGAGVFVVAGAAALAIALLTVSYQALRAAWMNPTEAIRNE